MRLRTVLVRTAAIAVVVAAVAGAYVTRDTWRPRLFPAKAPPESADDAGHGHDHAEPGRVKLSPQARGNLRLVVQPLQPQTYWRTLQVPGMVVERPGQSDRGVSAPVAAVVTGIAVQPGDTVRPGETLFTLRLVSELLQNSQSELFKTTRDLQINQEQRERLAKSAAGGAIPESRLIELENQERRLKAAVLAYRQDLLARGLTPEQIAGAAEGRFVTEVQVVAPRRPGEGGGLLNLRTVSMLPPDSNDAALAYEVQELKVHLGEQVQAGQTLALLANHQSLYVEGRGFKQEAAQIERAAQQGWPVEAEFAEDPEGAWPPLEPATFQIRYLANTVDPVSRTFPFYLPLANTARPYSKDGRTFLVWRFRPGQRVRLRIPVERLPDVFVLPAEAVVREGPEVYVFRQNGDFFERRPVRVLFEDRSNVVLANDGSVGAGVHVARNAAGALNRALKAAAGGGDGGHGHEGHHHHHDH